MSDLHIELDPTSRRRAGLEAALRDAIRRGALVSGTRLPSSRSLASELSVARSTVVSAYEQLIVEGYLSARHGSGTRVAWTAPANAEAVPTETRVRFRADFRPGEPDVTMFPRSDWATAVRWVLSNSPAETFGYGDPRGLAAAREALVSYLGRTRAVVADPSRLFVFSGFADALSSLANLLSRIDGRPIAVEEPCLPLYPAAIDRAGASLEAVSVDDEGVVVAELARTSAGSVLITPAHQYPLGVTLSRERRTALVEWARERNGWIIEDDYDSEFRYDREPIGSVQGLAPDRVIYAGTASKTIAPGVGIGWLVVPPPLVEALADQLRLRIATSTIEQAALARFIDSGRMDRHVRRMRAVYRRRRDVIVNILSSESRFDVRGIAAGLHVTAHVSASEVENQIVQRAADNGVGLLKLTSHYRGSARRAGIVVGYSRPPEHAFAAAARRFRAAVSPDRVSR